MPQTKGYVAITVIISLIVGAFAGAFGSFFLKPYMESTEWGKRFLESNITQQLSGQKKVVKVTEDSSTIDVVKQTSPSVVSIVVTKELTNFYNLTGPDVFNFAVQDETGKYKSEVSGGTGFVVDKSGLILTNKHVVIDEDAEYSVLFNNGDQYEATVLARDFINDIAVLKIEAEDLKAIEMGDSEKVEIGQTAIAIGNALGEYSNTVTKGVVSGVDRQITTGAGFGNSEIISGAIQTDVAINPGNSGGPLLNIEGQVIGINTAINWQGRAIGFAIPSNQAKEVLDSVKQYGKIVRPWLGVRYVELTPEIAIANDIAKEYGALIVSGGEGEPAIELGSPADKAGLQENDIVLAVGEQVLDAEHNLVAEIAKNKPGDEIELKIYRAGEELVIKVILAEREK